MFTYKKIKASDMGLRVLNDVVFTSPARDVELVQIPGRDGDLIIDNGRYESVIRSIPCRLETNKNDVEKLIDRINNWLISSDGFNELLWYNDPDYVYQAKIEGHVESQRILSRFAETVIDFRLHPIKHLRSSLKEREIFNGSVIVNNLVLSAKPIIRVVGTGDVTLQIKDQQVELTELPGGCIVDSERQTITNLSGDETLFSNMRSYPFPKLVSGHNPITWTGNDVKVFVIPRLGALV